MTIHPPSDSDSIVENFAENVLFRGFLGLIAATFWTLLANGIVATQVVEDGTLSSVVVRILPS